RLRFSGPKTSIICSPMTSLKTSIKTITYLSDIGCLEIQGASLVDISIVCNFTVDKCELNPAYVIKNIDSPKDLLNGQKKRSSSENRISYSIKLADEKYPP
ncbi:hypothetical protein, partial [Escherichia coli]|uniref:hypothetical protein n=1 Tax=Escherichia coli TaxID=562 RepID=UPI003CD00069